MKVFHASIGANAYRSEHGTYRGLTPRWIDRNMRAKLGVRVLRATRTSYCLEARSRWRNVFQNGPTARISRGTCARPRAGTPIPRRKKPPPPPVSQAQANVRLAALATFAYYADNGGYQGMTLEKLRVYDRSIDVTVVRATATTFCIESTVGGTSAFMNGPDADVAPGRCPV